MDTFIEQIVKKRKSAGEIAIIVVTLLLAVALVLGFWMFVPPFVVFAAAIAGFCGWWMITAQNKEYEYCVTNGDIDIDMIIAKRKRQRLVSVAGRKVESLLPYKPGTPQNGFQRVVVTAPSLKDTGLWMFTYNSKKNGRTMVVFQPEERVLKALYSGLGRLVQMDTQKAVREAGLAIEL